LKLHGITQVQPRLPSGSDVAETVLSATGRGRAIRLPLGILAAFALHVAMLWGIRHGSLGSPVPESATGSAKKEDEFDLSPFPPPPPSVVPERTPPGHPAALTRVPAAAVHSKQPSGVQAAQAATVLAQAPESSTPVDLTADAVVTGSGTTYAGGATASTGTGTSPVQQGPAAPGSRQPTSSVALDHSSSVSLPTESWSCPWPRDADAEQIDQQTVILRVVVTSTGDPESATVLSDPGHGFGPAALACAMRTHFAPARDAKGNPRRATSPPIRVRFTR
jgi:protein TonB